LISSHPHDEVSILTTGGVAFVAYLGSQTGAKVSMRLVLLAVPGRRTRGSEPTYLLSSPGLARAG
jgi:hypothetical protein